MSFKGIYHHRLKYFLSPQIDLYKNIAKKYELCGKMVLDYGCGNGVGSIILKEDTNYVLGIDSDPCVIEFANDVFGHLVDFKECDWSSEHFKCKFDLICCIEVIEHIEDSRKVLEVFKENLSPGGIIIVSTLNHNSQYRKNNEHVGKHTVGGFRILMNLYFPGVKITDYQLENDISDDSTVTPMVAVWEKAKQ